MKRIRIPRPQSDLFDPQILSAQQAERCGHPLLNQILIRRFPFGFQKHPVKNRKTHVIFAGQFPHADFVRQMPLQFVPDFRDGLRGGRGGYGTGHQRQKFKQNAGDPFRCGFIVIPQRIPKSFGERFQRIRIGKMNIADSVQVQPVHEKREERAVRNHAELPAFPAFGKIKQFGILSGMENAEISRFGDPCPLSAPDAEFPGINVFHGKKILIDSPLKEGILPQGAAAEHPAGERQIPGAVKGIVPELLPVMINHTLRGSFSLFCRPVPEY